MIVVATEYLEAFPQWCHYATFGAGRRSIQANDVATVPIVMDGGHLIPGFQTDAVGNRMGDIPLWCEQNIPLTIDELLVHIRGQMPNDFLTSSTLALARSRHAA